MSQEILISERLQRKKSRNRFYDPFDDENKKDRVRSLSFVDRKNAPFERMKAEREFEKSLERLYGKLWRKGLS